PPFGAQTHLWRLPAYHAAPIALRSSGSIPGAWAPSTNVSLPRSASAATIRATGRGEREEGVAAALGNARDAAGDRQDERRRARDVAQDGDPGPVRDRVEHRVDGLVLVPDRERDPGHDDTATRFLGDMPGHVEDRVVLVVVGHDLVARAKAERAQHRVRGA